MNLSGCDVCECVSACEFECEWCVRKFVNACVGCMCEFVSA